MMRSNPKPHAINRTLIVPLQGLFKAPYPTMAFLACELSRKKFGDGSQILDPESQAKNSKPQTWNPNS